MKAGFIGIGQMGVHMARHVQAAGYSLVVHDVNRDAAAPLLETGAEWAGSPGEVARAREFGATHGVNAGAADPVAAVREFTGGRGADYVFVTVGSSAAMQQAWSMLVRGGTAVMVGMPPASDPPLSITAGELAFTEKTLTGGFMGSIRLQSDIPRLIALYKAGRYKLDELITGRYPFERINEAIESSAAGEALRNVLIFE